MLLLCVTSWVFLILASHGIFSKANDGFCFYLFLSPPSIVFCYTTRGLLCVLCEHLLCKSKSLSQLCIQKYNCFLILICSGESLQSAFRCLFTNTTHLCNIIIRNGTTSLTSDNEAWTEALFHGRSQARIQPQVCNRFCPWTPADSTTAASLPPCPALPCP